MSQSIYLKSGTGPNVVFLHGWQNSKESWSSIVECLKNDFCCWTIDLPGFGANPETGSLKNPMDYANWLIHFLNEHSINNFYLVGHSFGGRVALCFASKNPSNLKKMVLYGTPGYDPPAPGFTNLLIALYRKLGLAKSSLVQKSALFKKMQARLRSSDYQDAGKLEDIYLNTVNYSLEDKMEKVSVPTLIIHGRNDTAVPLGTAQKMHAAIAGSELTVANGSHFLHLEKPLLFYGYLRKFFLN